MAASSTFKLKVLPQGLQSPNWETSLGPQGSSTVED